jgi:hypothetical protein
MFNTMAFPGTAPFAPSPFDISGAVDLGGCYAIAPVGRVFFVRGNSSGQVPNLDDQYTANSTKTQKCYPTVKSILDKGLCKASRGDVIVCLPGHVENIAAADAWTLVAGLRIIGLGRGDTRPTFTFSVAAATVLIDVAGVSIENCRFLCAGPAGAVALTVAAPFTVSAEGCSLIGNYFEVGIDADQLCTAFLTTTAAADNLTIAYNDVRGLVAAAAITSMFVFVGADNLRFIGNRCKAGFANAATGLLSFITTLSKNVLIQGNILHQWTATSTGGISMATDLAHTGEILDNEFRTEDTAATGIVPLVMHANVLIRQGRNYVSNEKQTRGVLIGTEAA